MMVVVVVVMMMMMMMMMMVMMVRHCARSVNRDGHDANGTGGTPDR